MWAIWVWGQNPYRTIPYPSEHPMLAYLKDDYCNYFGRIVTPKGYLRFDPRPYWCSPHCCCTDHFPQNSSKFNIWEAFDIWGCWRLSDLVLSCRELVCQGHVGQTSTTKRASACSSKRMRFPKTKVNLQEEKELLTYKTIISYTQLRVALSFSFYNQPLFGKNTIPADNPYFGV